MIVEYQSRDLDNPCGITVNAATPEDDVVIFKALELVKNVYQRCYAFLHKNCCFIEVWAIHTPSKKNAPIGWC